MSSRCWGITTKMKRCARHGEWHAFCTEHRFSYLKIIVPLAAFMVALVGFLANSKPLLEYMLDPKDKFYGTWDEHFDLPIENGSARADGQITYFKNGRYNFSGKLKYLAQVKSIGPITFTYDAVATGSWTADKSTLTISREDYSYTLDSINTGLGTEFDEVFKKKMVSDGKDKNKFLDGLNDQYKVLKSSDLTIQLEGTTPERKKFAIYMNKI